MRHTLTLSNVYDSDLNKVGFRALDLAKVFQEKYKVPLSFVVTNLVFEEFLAQSRLLVNINSLLKEVDLDDRKSLDAAYSKIKELFSKATIPVDFLDQLEESYNALSVKDDVIGADDFLKEEDPVVNLFVSPNYALDHDSFRGAFFNVKGFKSFLDTLKSCWLSLFSPEEIRFRHKQGVSELRVGVLVQRLVVPDVCVEAYSAGLGGNDILLKAYLGLPDITKSSSKDVFSVSRDYLKVVSANKLNQEFKLSRGPTSGVLVKKYLKGKGNEQKVSDLEASDVARLVKRFRSMISADFKAVFLVKKGYVYCSLISRVPGPGKTVSAAPVEEPEESFDPDADDFDLGKEEYVGDQDFAVSPSGSAGASEIIDDEPDQAVHEDAESDQAPEAQGNGEVEQDDFIVPGDGVYDEFLALEPVFLDVLSKRYEELFGVPLRDASSALEELSERVPLAEREDLALFISLKDKLKQGEDIDLDALHRVSESVRRFIGEDS